MSMSWTHQRDAWLPTEEVWRRASGRRRVNALRRFRATMRRILVFQLRQQGMCQRDIAICLEVDRSTVSRDCTAFDIALGAATPGITMGEAIRRVPPRRQW